MNFDKIVEKVGFGLAVVIAVKKGEGPDKYCTNFVQWYEFYCVAPNILGDYWPKFGALEGMLRSGGTFEQWLKVFNDPRTDAALKVVAHSKIFGLAQDLVQCMTLYEMVRSDEMMRGVILDRMAELAEQI